MPEQTRKQLNYTIACIHEFANRHQISQKDAFHYLDKYRGLSFLLEFYDVEHTLSLDDALDDMASICRQNGGKISCLRQVF